LASDGVRHVLVNGRFALRDGKPTGEKSGKVLMRTADLPSRPMRMQQSRSLSVKTQDIALQLTQAADGKARGTLRFSDPQSKMSYQLAEFGLLQTHSKWASFTARVKSGAEERAALIVLDGGNPLKAQATLRVEIEGGRRWEMPLKPSDYQINQ
jgi:hypothetical protein